VKHSIQIAGTIVTILAFFLGGRVQAQDSGNAQRTESPDVHLWHALKKELTSSDGPDYFAKNILGTELPTLVGKLVAATPQDQPSVLVLQMYDSDKPAVTLQLRGAKGHEAHMPGPMTLGSIIRFEGIGVSFTREPFMVTFEVDVNPRTAHQN